MRGLADELCGGRLVFALEGGYSPTGLAEGTAAVLEAALRPAAPRVGPVDMPAGSMLRRSWSLRSRCTGAASPASATA